MLIGAPMTGPGELLDDELLKEFLLESAENLNQLDQDFVALEQQPNDRERLGAIFRCVHTIKGTSGFLGFSKLESLTHAGESLLSRLRDGTMTLNAQLTSLLLAMVDAIRRILASIESSAREGDEDLSQLTSELARAARADAEPSALAAPAPPALAPAPLPAPVTAAAEATPPAKASVELPVEAPAPAEPDAAQPKSPAIVDTTIRVDVGLLDRMMNLVGELVLARNQILQFGSTVRDAGFISASQRLNLLTTELQEGVMKTRMQPIGNVWNKFPRIVRDLSRSCGKHVELDLDGTETELDRTIIEAIKDPLTHAVRNAVDHGIESPEKRRAAGKSDTGRLALRAYHEGGQVNIEVSDDGAGLDIERIRAKAIERGLVTASAASRMGEREVSHLIFQPGFSTAEKVTNVSGRGVGMDVVKTHIEKIGGSVDISSVRGAGSTLKIKIPLTLAIIPALIVTSGRERFAIPQVNLLELVRLEAEQARRSLERLDGTTVYRLRGNLLPIVFLDETLALSTAEREDDAVNIVVLQADDRQFGLVVGGISDTEEIVVKPLGKELRGMSTFAGATIMGDGKVALILDVLGIAQRSNVVAAARERVMVEKANVSTSTSEKKEALLLFKAGDHDRMAIPLSMVARLEEIDPSKVEQAAGRSVVQYRGEILPLVHLGTADQGRATDIPMQVIVYSDKGKSVGFVVDQILDAVEEAITVRQAFQGEGVLGTAVVQGRVTDMLDVSAVIRRDMPGFFTGVEAA